MEEKKNVDYINFPKLLLVSIGFLGVYTAMYSA